jgi:hypothetical protein
MMVRRSFFGAELAHISLSLKERSSQMNRAIPLDEISGLPHQAQNLSVSVFCTDRTRVSLPDKEELLSLVRLHRKQAPANIADVSSEANPMLFPSMSSDYENR